MRPRPLRRLALAAPLAAPLAALVLGCVPHQTRRPGSDMVIVRRTFNPVEAIARTQCEQPPAGPAVGDSLGARQRCAVVVPVRARR